MKNLKKKEQSGDVKYLPMIISDHLKRERKPVNDTEFAGYLTGLLIGNKIAIKKIQEVTQCSIEGKFHEIKTTSNIIIKLHSTDIGLAYYLKKKIKYGQVKILPTYKVIYYSIKEAKGISKIYELVSLVSGDKSQVLLGAKGGSPEKCMKRSQKSPEGIKEIGYGFTGFLDSIVGPEDIGIHFKTKIETRLTGGPFGDHSYSASWINLRKADMVNIKSKDNHEVSTGYLKGGHTKDGILCSSAQANNNNKPTEPIFEVNIKSPPLVFNHFHTGEIWLGANNKSDGDSGFRSALKREISEETPLMRIKVSFPNKKIRRLIWQLDNYPLISSKFIKYLKYRKIYRICQRKEHLKKTGLIKILSLWRVH